jgi:hypothetical protein
VRALEPVGNGLHRRGGVDDLSVFPLVDQAAGIPHVLPEVCAVGADAPVVEVAEGLSWLVSRIMCPEFRLLLIESDLISSTDTNIAAAL